MRVLKKKPQPLYECKHLQLDELDETLMEALLQSRLFVWRSVGPEADNLWYHNPSKVTGPAADSV